MSSSTDSVAQPQDEAVLGEVLVNQTALRQGQPVEAEDPDLALAKMLQAQEQAWLAMAGASSGVIENLPPAGSGEAGPAGSAGQSREGGSSSGGGGSGEDGEAEGDEEEGEEQQEKELTDEEVARRMQEEEEREFQQRLLALAGVGPGGAAATGSGGAAGGAGGGGGGLARDLAGELAEAAGEYLSEDDVDPDDMTYEELTALGEAVGTVSRGIAEADVAALPLQAYYEVAGTTEGSEEQCPICRVEYEPEDSVRILPLCRHYYHPDCIGEWLQRNKVCCICNKEVLEEAKQGQAAAARAGACSGGVLGERLRQ